MDLTFRKFSLRGLIYLSVYGSIPLNSLKKETSKMLHVKDEETVIIHLQTSCRAVDNAARSSAMAGRAQMFTQVFPQRTALNAWRM
jgi:hypothetical protein